MPIRRALERSFSFAIAAFPAAALAACASQQTNFPPPVIPATPVASAQQVDPGAGAPAPQQDASEKPAPDAVHVRFVADRADDHWSLLTPEGKVVCTLPCARWLGPGSGMVLERERHGATNVERIAVPTDFGVRPGETVELVARSPRSARAGRALEGAAVVAAVGSLAVYALLSNRGGDSIPIVIGSLAGVTVGLLVAGIYLTTVSHPTDVVLRTASSSAGATFALGPGYLDLRGASGVGLSPLHLVLTPLGAAGTF